MEKIKTFKSFIEWYDTQKITKITTKTLKPKYQWFVDIYNSKLKISTIHLKYLEYFNIQTQKQFPKCPYCDNYCGT